MGPGKKDLEIVYNLQWKNVPGQSDDKANIVGMYDIPATTLNWETFKSYLLKNSGATGDDVKVSYVSIDDKEFPIESQLDFQIALYSFRQRARNGDIITLKLDRISDQGTSGGRIKRLRRSVEPHMEKEKIQAAPPEVKQPVAPVALQNDAPPDWFKKYMKGFKKEIVEDVTKSVTDYVSNLKTASASTQFPCHHARKTKVECTKRTRRSPMQLNKPDADRELLKSLKLERKLDNKLEKLEQKTLKIKEKKLCLARNTDDDISSRSSSKSRPIGLPLSDTEILMDASAVGQHELTIPHMSGGETYQQEWEVINTGDVEWTEYTELRYAWGSESLKPVERIVPCPNLKPGEKGTVVVYLEIPKKPGNYECYWHFYHDGHRFGHWLGCQVIVDPPATKTSPIRLFLNHADKELLIQATNNLKCHLDMISQADKPLNTKPSLVNYEHATEGHNISSDLEGLKIYDTEVNPDSNSSSDSDNQSIVSIADSNSSMHSGPTDEFVVVAMPETVTVLDEDDPKELENSDVCIPLIDMIKLEKIDDVKPDNSMLIKESNLDAEEVTVVEETTQQNSEPVIEIKEEPLSCEAATEQPQLENTNAASYAYISVNGEKIAVPKYLLRADYLATAEDADPPAIESLVVSESQKDDVISIDGCVSMASNSEGTQHVQPNGNTPLDLTLEKEEIPSPKIPEDHYVSAEFNMSSSMENPNKSRLFVFPLNCPGFEVVYPPNSCVASLPPDFESIESNQNPPMDGNAGREVPYGVLYVNPSCPHYEGENPYHNWTKSESAYSYTPNAPPPLGFTLDPNSHPPQGPSGYNNSFHEAFASEAGAPHTLHHRFGSYMRRPAFNHAKHCSGMHCRQPLYKSPPATPPKCAEATETFSQYSNDSNNYQKRYRVYMPRVGNPTGITMPQNMPRKAASHEGQNTPSAESAGRSSTVHILPDTLVSGAVNVASSAINTARSVLNMFSPPPKQEQGQWENGVWISNDPESPRARGLRVLSEMGFWDHNLNATLLARYNDDLARVISELVQ